MAALHSLEAGAGARQLPLLGMQAVRLEPAGPRVRRAQWRRSEAAGAADAR